jgi:hypothetical protein
MDERFRGLGSRLVTPFRTNGQIDYAGLEKLIEHQITGGVDYVVTMGTTGESVTLTKAEKKQLLAETIGFVRNRVPVVLGVGGNNTAEVVETLRRIRDGRRGCHPQREPVLQQAHAGRHLPALQGDRTGSACGPSSSTTCPAAPAAT